MKRITYFVLIGLLCSFNAYTQEEYTAYDKLDSLEKVFANETIDSIKFKIIDQLQDLADEHNHIEEILKYIEWEEELANKTKNSNRLLAVRYTKARVYFGRYYKMDTSLIFLREAMAIMDTCAPIAKPVVSKENFWNIIGLIHKNKSDFDSAIYYYKKVLSNPEGSKSAQFYATYNISNTYSMVGNDELALKYAHENYRMAEETNTDYISTSRSLLGKRYFAQGLYERAIEMHMAVVEWLSQEYVKYERTIVSQYQEIAQSTRKLGRNQETIDYLNKVLIYYEKIYGKDHIKSAASHANIGEALMLTGKLDEGLEHFETALRIAKENDHHILYAQIFGALGTAWERLNEYDKAIENFKISMSLLGKKNPTTNTGINQQLGGLYMKTQDYRQAVSTLKKSVVFIDSTSNLIAANISPTWYNALRIKLLGQAYEKLGHETQKLSDSELALYYYHLADTITTKVKGLYKQQDDEIDLSVLLQDLYSSAARTATNLYGKNRNVKYLNEAFDFTEKGKSSILLSATMESRPDYLGLPDSLLDLEVDLKSNIEYYQNRLARQAKDDKKIEWYKMRLTQFKSNYENLMYKLEEDYPEYYQLRFDNNYLSLPDIGKNLSSDETVISYNYSDSSLNVFVVDKNNTSYLAIPLSADFDSLVYKFNQSLKDRFSEDYVEYGRQLYDFVYGPIAEKVETSELVIIPDGILWHVNFELLIPEGEELKFLFQDKAMIYSNSANQYIRLKSNSEVEKECLAFSYAGENDVIDGQNIDLTLVRDSQGNLPGTLTEIKGISEILTGNYLYGDEATESNFKKLAGDYSILHLALHGEIDDETPNHSKLFFAENQSDTLNDGFLHAYELYGMQLNADMVVLSACNTGVGQIIGGEGIMSLGRAFQYAGTNSVLLSNWEVVDGVAPELMRSFYAYLKDGKSKSEALRLAKVDFLESADVLKSHPYYWGSFTLMGNNASLKDDSFSKYVIYWIAAGSLILLLFFLWRSKRRVAVY